MDNLREVIGSPAWLARNDQDKAHVNDVYKPGLIKLPRPQGRCIEYRCWVIAEYALVLTIADDCRAWIGLCDTHHELYRREILGEG